MTSIITPEAAKRILNRTGEELEQLANKSKATGIIKVGSVDELIKHLQKK